MAAVVLGAWTVTKMAGSGATEEEAPPWPPCRRTGDPDWEPGDDGHAESWSCCMPAATVATCACKGARVASCAWMGARVASCA